MYVVLSKGLSLFFCMWLFSFTSTICWKDCPFPVEYSWHPCQNHLTIFMKVYFWALYSSPLIYRSVLMSTPHCFFCFFGHPQHMEFLGQDLYLSCANAEALTHYVHWNQTCVPVLLIPLHHSRNSSTILF